ncbi:PAS domain S-box protein [Gracilimonas tropica]|uniref:PAS domain S-box protein n=1 Tax=Gracilimonas tropica TaxID=454600 RepID=UPI000378DBE0|nr:PAS domain S-box protein [Gracilimonas tropica]
MTVLDRNLNLLVVEDNPGDFVLLQEYLAEIVETIGIKHAKSYSEAEAELTTSTFDAILLDLSLPDVSGESLVEKIVDLSGNIPVIVFTGYENQEFALKTLGMGVADYVLKDEITPFMLGKVIAYGIERNRVRQSLQKSEKKYRDIFDLSPQPMFLIDVENRTIQDVNVAAVNNYGYSKDEFIGLHLKDIRPIEEHVNFENEITKIEKKESKFHHTTVKHQRKNGEVFDVELSTSEVVIDDKRLRMAMAEDVTEKLKAEKNVSQKSSLLAANAKVTGTLIKNEDWIEALAETFDAVGKAVEVDRVYYFETHTHPNTNELLISQRIEWSREDVEPQLDNPELQDIKINDYNDHFPKLQKNKVYQALVKDISDHRLKSILEGQDIISILHIPIFVDGHFQGFIGFDDCQKERIWDEEEIQYLQTLASNISSAIKLRQTTEELKVSEYKFKSMVEEGGDLIEILDEKGNFKFVSPNLKNILGWKAEEMIGKNAFDFVHPDDKKQGLQDFLAMKEGRDVDIRPFRFRDKNGKYNWLKTAGTNLLNDPHINGILFSSTDITEQRYYNEVQKLERDVLEKNALNKNDIAEITREFLSGIEKLHSGIKTSVCLVEKNKIRNLCSPSFPPSFAEEVDGVEVDEKAGSCGAAVYHKKQIIIPNVYKSSYWKDYLHLAEKYGFEASWSQPIFDSKGEVRASFSVYYDKPSEPTKYEHNTVERAAHILRILFDSEDKEQAEQQLALSEKRFKALVQEGSDLISILDEDLQFKYISPSVGGSYDSYLGKKALDFVHPEDFERVKQKIHQLPNEKRISVSAYRLRDHKGIYHWVETIFTNLLEDPAVEGYVANSRNVTKQIEREEKLKELSLVAAKTTDAVIISDNKKLITWVNKGFEQLTGYQLDEVKGRKPGDFLQGADTNTETVQEISEALNQQRSIETTILNYDKKGKPYWLNMSIDPIFDDKGNCTHFIAIERDVTEKIRREKELQESLERYDIVNKATSDTIWDLDIESNIMLYNSNIYNMFGYNKQEVKNAGSWWKDKIHPEDLHIVNNALEKVLNNGTERFQMEYRFMAADGTYKYILDRAFVIKDDQGNPHRMIGAMQDVTKEREEQEQLKLLESVVTNTSESVIILNAEKGKHGREIIFTNHAFTELTGYTAEEVIGETLHFLNGPETDPQVRAKLRTAMDNRKDVEVEFINYKKNGEKFWINTSMVPVQNSDGEYTHWVAIGRDITEQKKTEKEIKASLAEKETLLAEIHHRVKNNLAVVSGMMQLQAFESDNKELQNKLYDSVVRIKTMATVHELLYQSNSFSQIEFSDTLKNLAKNISGTLQHGDYVELNINCDPIKLNINQAIPASLIVNEVITNAYKHAFGPKDRGIIKFNLTESDGVINIEISDNGQGFGKENILESGSLGIHLINVLCEQLQGQIRYENQSEGTLFNLQFERKETKKGIGNAGLNF